MEKNRDVIIACDFSSGEELTRFLKPFWAREIYPFLKIGMELFYKEGSNILYRFPYEHKIFLDLKLFDIPTTVRKAIEVLPVDMIEFLSIHSMGGVKMMKEALKSIDAKKLAAVTVLTSVTEDEFLDEAPYWERPGLSGLIYNRAYYANESGINTIICSAQDIVNMEGTDNVISYPPVSEYGYTFPSKTALTGKMKYICPGIRMEGDDVDDQKRFVTPQEAKEMGADYIVVGRSITKSNNPVEKYELCKKMFI
jgi:orotidine-5'-phosphate decarboxylase